MTGAERRLRPRRPDALRPLENVNTRLILGISGIVLVVGYGVLAAHNTAIARAELGVDQAFNMAHTPFFDAVALTIAWLFGPPMAVLITTVSAVGIALLTRNVMRGLTFAGIVAVGWGASEIVKLALQRPRPDAALLAHPLLTEHSFSYPSGHTCFVAALTIACVVTARDRSRRRGIAIAGAVLVVLVATSRVYLGVHYPSDVLAAIVFGSAAAEVAAVVWLGHGLVWVRAGTRGTAWWAAIDPTGSARDYAEPREALHDDEPGQADAAAHRGRPRARADNA
jgi:undecaprenyl-diphosphatase